jgi:hypothetical protein
MQHATHGIAGNQLWQCAASDCSWLCGKERDL